MNTYSIELRRASIVRVLAAIICFLAVAHVASSLTRHLGGYPTVYGLVPLFDLNGEQNVPTYFNASLHLVSSMLLAIIAVSKTAARDRFSRQWTVLCAGFLFHGFRRSRRSADQRSAV